MGDGRGTSAGAPVSADAAPPARSPSPTGVGKAGRRHEAVLALVTGAVLVGATAVAGLWFHLRPGPGRIDTRLLALVGPSRGGWYLDVTALHRPWVVVAGAAVAAAVAVRRDRARALACLVGPPLALVVCELVAKPLVGRSLQGVLSYPSGSTVGAAALATALVLATPARWRALTVVLGVVYIAAMCIAVVALRWHYPSDALGGVALGVGVVLLVDGASWWVLGRRGVAQRRRAGPAPPSRSSPASG
jgi:membrane-associated phospholipid phosphatase